MDAWKDDISFPFGGVGLLSGFRNVSFREDFYYPNQMWKVRKIHGQILGSILLDAVFFEGVRARVTNLGISQRRS